MNCGCIRHLLQESTYCVGVSNLSLKPKPHTSPLELHLNSSWFKKKKTTGHILSRWFLTRKTCTMKLLVSAIAVEETHDIVSNTI
jgi:hypothetical protein